MACEEFLRKIGIYKEIRIQKKLFGTFGFRGVIGRDIKEDKIRRIGETLSAYLGEGKTIVIGKDPRGSSDLLENSLCEGIIEKGCNALTLGIITPSALSVEILRQSADAGVMITASHNPPEYNGIKCYNNNGIGFSPEEDIELEKIYFGEINNSINKPTKKGKIFNDNNANRRYIDHSVQSIKKLFKIKPIKIKPMKIVVDGGGGSASFVTPSILERLGHNVVRFNCDFDAMFKKRDPEPIEHNLGILKTLVKEENADIGIAHDGDGDRTAFVTEEGEFIQGDVSATIIADHLLRDKEKKKIAVTIAFSKIIENVVDQTDIIYTPVGEPYLAQAKLLCGAQVGLEEHGSVLIERSREGPMLAGIMAGILIKEQKTFSELVYSYPRYYQIKDSKTFHQAITIPNIRNILDNIKQEIPQNYIRLIEMDGLRVDYPEGWFIIRTSGTEPKVRIFSEGKTEKISKRLNNIAKQGLEKAQRQFNYI